MEILTSSEVNKEIGDNEVLNEYIIDQPSKCIDCQVASFSVDVCESCELCIDCQKLDNDECGGCK